MRTQLRALSAVTVVLTALPVGAQTAREIVFAARAENEAINLYLTDAQGASSRVVAPSQGSDNHPTWTPEGSRIVFVSDRAGGPDLYVTDSEGVDLRPLNIPLPSRGAMLAAPDLSPDGSQLAYQVEDGATADMWTAETDGSHTINLSRGQGRSRRPDWSPDGRTIYFESDRDGETALYRMEADGSHVERLTPGEWPAVSPGGQVIAYAFQGAVWACEPNGHHPRVLVGVGEQPVCSDDGSRLAYIVRAGGRAQLHTAAADGSDQRITPLPYEGVQQPAW